MCINISSKCQHSTNTLKGVPNSVLILVKERIHKKCYDHRQPYHVSLILPCRGSKTMTRIMERMEQQGKRVYVFLNISNYEIIKYFMILNDLEYSEIHTFEYIQRLMYCNNNKFFLFNFKEIEETMYQGKKVMQHQYTHIYI